MPTQAFRRQPSGNVGTALRASGSRRVAVVPESECPLAALILLAVVAIVVAVTIWRRRQVIMIYAPTLGLLYRGGRFERELPPGRYVWLDPLKRTKVVKNFDRRVARHVMAEHEQQPR